MDDNQGFNYFQVISDPYCDFLGLPRSTTAQSFINWCADRGDFNATFAEADKEVDPPAVVPRWPQVKLRSA